MNYNDRAEASSRSVIDVAVEDELIANRGAREPIA